MIEGNKLGKKAHVEDVVYKNDVEEEVVQAIVWIKWVRIDLSHDSKPKTDLGRTSSKNPMGDGLVSPAHKFPKLVTKTSSKVQEPKIFDEAINDYIHGIGGIKLSIRSCGTLTLFRPGATLHCYTTKR